MDARAGDREHPCEDDTFHVIDAAGHRSDVGVVDPGNGRARYLRTYVDGDWNNSLLALPECVG